ncbi:hypothetical protein MYSTI_02135 [Myxococcus stipitatus DSM 14675]|uniref:DUF4267 domain-containing protein n=1 Tax=Myxococcus stipitatus (strain DSM 14675 / JCM 12634 / Mx s8) TaxID=1278073 RepID=L7U7D6_MYXSD|nr:DUF4267 domain-containing protein [Myxococcus stipitatus]AGC43462.1 hypothetical protein MYSTI_02135 [Myxococcus stipitatus DSM 14675]
MNPSHSQLSWRLTSPTALFTLLLGAFLLFLSLRGALDPISAARGFGLTDSGSEVIPWLYVKAGRDFGLALAMFALVAIRQRKAAGVFVLATIVMPTVDALTVLHGGASLAFALGVHGSAVVYGVVLAAALLRPQKVTS